MQRGDILQLGRHRLMCGDAFSESDRAALLQGEKPDMLYCDPPYGISHDTKDAGRFNRSLRKWGRETDAIVASNVYPPTIGDDVPFDPAPLITSFANVPEQFWWGANNYAKRLPDEGSWIVWDKRLDERFDKMGGSRFELCWSRKSHAYLIARVRWVGFYGNQTEPGRKRVHPNHKPVVLSEWFLERYSKSEALILDLFGGSGSTLLACERMGRRGYLMEISPDYCNVILERYNALKAKDYLPLLDAAG